MRVNYIYIFSLLLFLLFNCSNIRISKYKLTQKKKDQLIRIVDSMYEIDQGTREALYVQDSIFNLPGDSFMYYNRPNILKKELHGSYRTYRNKIDSIVDSMKESDISNTEKLIEITKNNGFPSNKRLDVYKAKAYMIFVHSPRKYFPEIRKLITKEYNAGRIDGYKKGYIFWHLNGRKGMPPTSGPNGEAIWNNIKN